MFENEKSHESFGMIQIHRTQGGNSNLFGSNIENVNKIQLSIYPGQVQRELNQEWYSVYGSPYIQIDMSPIQFAEAITNMNTQGVPCTITSLNGKTIENCPHENKRKQFDNEFKEIMIEISNKLDRLTERAGKILNQTKAPKKSEKEEILDEINKLKMAIGSNIPFIKKQFSKQMDKNVMEAKGEIEVYIIHKINTLGLKELQKQNILLEEGENNEI